ncbi:MAG TPA: 2-amino-4-hydroxy-6-hydroxymethyldihydropteridine diphosphokinase [Pseudomonadales bacterium]|nr:2-amino-4-hydroxy-6-hydroxymethyldihydropteridine diphosphokinase [Pseudomonadales bacterium]
MQNDVYIALGSNLGDRRDNLNQAIEKMTDLLHCRLDRSSFWQSQPDGMADDAGLFMNAVVRATTDMSVRNLFGRLQKIEEQMGRPRIHQKNISRIIDLDIILFGTDQVKEPGLVVPHPRFHERLFVLLPLSELAADLNLPGCSLSVDDLIAAAPAIDISRLS